MQRSAAIVLQIAIVALGILIFAALLYEPTIEGVNANATSAYEIYFDDPFLAYIYFSFIAVFIGLYQAFKLLGYIGQGSAYSQKSMQALRTIKYCALLFAGLISAAVVYIFVVAARTSDDIAGGVAMGLFMIIVSLVVATVAAVFQRTVRKKMQAP